MKDSSARTATYRFEVAGGTLGFEASGSVDVLSESSSEVHLRINGRSPLVLRLLSMGGEHLVGLGERFVRLEQTGRRWDAMNSDLLFAQRDDTYCYVPLLFSSAGYAILVESVARCLWDLQATDPGVTSATVAAAAVDVRLFRGMPAEIIRNSTLQTGRPLLPPPWVFGVWKTTLGGTEAVLRQAQALLDRDIPVTACWTYDYFDEQTNTGCGLAGTYPPGEYGDLSNLTSSLHGLGYRVLGYVQPALYEGSLLFEDARKQHFLVHRRDGSPGTFPYFNPVLRPQVHSFLEPGGAYLDFTVPEARRWFQGLLDGALDLGFDGWMQDMGEHLTDDVRLADGSTGAAARNRYAWLYHEAAHEIWAKREAAAVFARSGTLGSLSLVSALWPGDEHADWSADRGLPSVIPAGLSAGLCGVTAWGPDIGGLVDGRDGGVGSLDEELWIRWCQYGALTPIMRDHLGFKILSRDPIDMWSTDRTRRVFRAYASLHIRLFPYLYRLAREGHATGMPILRALLLEYPDEDVAWTIGDEYLLGPNLLVAPVHEKGVSERRVWFPPGAWHSWWDDSVYEGPTWHDVPAPLEQIPLFRRGGAEIEMLDSPERRLDAYASI